MAKDRDIHIDILRCIGLLLVILAHIPINETIKSIRSFDVMLLVFIAGVSFVKSGRNNSNFNYRRYLIGRVKRLCVPTWLTLAIIFVLGAILCAIVHREYLYSFKQMLESIFFIGGMNGGIGNVWIVRIYMLMAFLTPLFIQFDGKVKNTWILIVSMLIALIINEAIVYVFYNAETFAGAFIENIVSSSICYSVGFMAGIRVAEQKNYSFLKVTLITFIPIFSVVQVIMYMKGMGFAPNSFKYPPQLYYCLYGIICTLILYVICSKININNSKIKSAIIWISVKSFDMYLAHTVVLKLISWGDAYLNKLFLFRIGILYYIFVLIVSAVLVYAKDVVKARVVRVRK